MKILITNLKKYYHQLRLQTKFTITHLLITTIPMLVIFFLFYGKLYDMVIADTIRTEQISSSQTIPMIDTIIDQVITTHEQVRQLSGYQKLFTNNQLNTGNHLITSSDLATLSQQTSSFIDQKLITDIRIYIDLPELPFLYTDSSPFLSMAEAKGAYWYGIYQGNQNITALYCPSFYLSPDEVNKYGDLAYITKSTFNYGDEVRTYFTAIYYSKQPFVQLLSDNLNSLNSVAYLINDRDSLIATSDDALAGIYHFNFDTVQHSFMTSNNFILKHVLSEDVYAGFYNITKANWFMVVVMPSQPIIKKGVWILVGFLFVYLACLAIAFFIATQLSRSITNRIASVINQMAKVRIGPPMALPASDNHDEIGNLIDTYNYMTTVINQLIAEQKKTFEDLRIAEFNSLQAQINPHFLYNTMDMINWLAQQGHTQDVSTAIQHLSRFYKLTLSSKQTITTIEQEIEHVTIYIRLQNMRYNNMIHFVVDIPDYLLDYPIPRLTFQPVIENAITHGILENIPKEGTIVLTGWLENSDTVVILISDDGVGITPQKLETILTGKGRSQKGTNIAVFNTHRRLQLLYGIDFGLSYFSTLGHGTDVEIRFPAQKNVLTSQ